MKCPKCKSENVTVELVQAGSKTKKQSIGLGGHVNNAARTMAAIGTFGVSNLVWKKSVGTEKSKTKMQKRCICQNCGYDWKG